MRPINAKRCIGVGTGGLTVLLATASFAEVQMGTTTALVAEAVPLRAVIECQNGYKYGDQPSQLVRGWSCHERWVLNDTPQRPGLPVTNEYNAQWRLNSG